MNGCDSTTRARFCSTENRPFGTKGAVERSGLLVVISLFRHFPLSAPRGISQPMTDFIGNDRLYSTTTDTTGRAAAVATRR
jgi:hypothetical protein